MLLAFDKQDFFEKIWQEIQSVFFDKKQLFLRNKTPLLGQLLSKNSFH